LGVHIKFLRIFDVISGECILGIETMKPHGTLGGTEHVITRISERWYKKAVGSKKLAC